MLTLLSEPQTPGGVFKAAFPFSGDRYCLEVVTQVLAARAAMAKIEQIVLADHLGSCVEQAIVSGDPEEQRKKVAELIDVFSRSDR